MRHSHRPPAKSPMPAAHPGSMTITLQIVSIVFYTFIAFLCIGLPIAVLPGYVHDQLGFSPLIAGLTIASQYLATLLEAGLHAAARQTRWAASVPSCSGSGASSSAAA